MKEPSLRGSRIAIAGVVAAVLLVGGGGFLLGRATTERAAAPVAQAPVTSAAPEPASAPEPEPLAAPGVLGRSDLLALAAQAADAASAGREPDIAGDLDGRRFELRLPFGCDGPAGENGEAAMRWRYDADAQALRVNVSPTLWQAADWWAAPPPRGVDAVEGFWLARPWTSSEDCPAERERVAPPGAEPVTLPGQTLAIGQVLPAEEARQGTRDRRTYDAVVRLPEDRLDASRGFRLRISGRIARIADGGAVRCRQPLGSEQRPVCLIGVVMDEVAIENPVSGETLATWNVSRRNATGS